MSSSKKRCSLRLRGLPRRGYVRLGEHEDRKLRVSSLPRRGFARLGEGRLRLGKPMSVLRSVFMACLGSVSWPDL